MKLSEFKYSLPENCIAQYPVHPRDHSRLMILNRQTRSIEHRVFKDIVEYFEEGDCIVTNETKVFPARLMGIKEKTDATVEVFLLRHLGDDDSLWEVLVKPARKVRIGNTIKINEHLRCDVIDNTTSGGRVVRFQTQKDIFDIIQEIGRMPLPPYIQREPEAEDKENYQTVYANKLGAVAAPTAGLHFTFDLLDKIKAKGVKIAPIILHVGLGTFRPVRVEDITRHNMDSEYFEVHEESVNMINESIKAGKRVVSVGTSTLRTLESVVTADNLVKADTGWTSKFIYPPYGAKIVNALVTNFHLPASTLLMLVSAFADREFIFEAYDIAIKEGYRFYSFGDGMLIL